MKSNNWKLSQQGLLGGRDEQQDSFASFDCSAGQLYVVADGVGGHSGGKQASQAAVAAIGDALTQVSFDNPIQQILEELAKGAHQAVQILREKEETKKASTTLALLLITATDAHRATMGDSRVYWLKSDGELVHSRDDSVAQMLVERGQLMPSEVRNHPDRNRLTKSLGNADFGGIEYETSSLSEVSSMLVASDGFWENHLESEIADLMSSDSDSVSSRLAEAASSAVDRAGAKADNTTVLLISPQEPKAESKPMPSSPTPQPSALKEAIVGIFIMLNLGLIAYLLHLLLS